MRIAQFGLIANILGIVAAVILFMNFSGDMGAAVPEDELGIFLPIIALVFGFLALRNIQKDENLVRSADRLR